MEERTEAAASGSRAGGVIRSRSNAGRHKKLAETPMLVHRQTEGSGLFAPTGGSPSTLPRLRRSQIPLFSPGHPARPPGPGPRDRLFATSSPSPPITSSPPAYATRNTTVLSRRQTSPARWSRVLLPKRMNFGGPKGLKRIARGHRLATPKNRSRERLLAPRARCTPACCPQVLARSWQFPSLPRRSGRQAVTMSNYDVIWSVGRFFNSRRIVRINPFIAFEFALTNLWGYPPPSF